MKKYKLGLILGRFQIFHTGHKYLVDYALKNCENVLILIGSADKFNTLKNPLTYEERAFIINTIYPDNKQLTIAPLDDIGVGDCAKWGHYVIESAKKIIGMPDCAIYGDEDKCKEWYKDYKNIEYIKVDRSLINTCSTDLKNKILDNDVFYFNHYMPEELHGFFNFYKLRLEKLKNS